MVINLNRGTTDTLLVLPSDSILSALEAGPYALLAKDSLGCMRQFNFTVPGNNPRAGQLVVRNACPAQSNGSITLTGLTGGTRPFDLELTRSDGFRRLQRDSVFASLTPGIYTLTVTDSSQPQWPLDIYPHPTRDRQPEDQYH